MNDTTQLASAAPKSHPSSLVLRSQSQVPVRPSFIICCGCLVPNICSLLFSPSMGSREAGGLVSDRVGYAASQLFDEMRGRDIDPLMIPRFCMGHLVQLMQI